MALTQVTPDVLHSNQGNITTVGTLSNLTVSGTLTQDGVTGGIVPVGGVAPSQIVTSNLYPFIKNKKMNPVELHIDEFAYKPLDTIEINHPRYKLADVAYPLFAVDNMPNPYNKKYRMIDGRHRLLKQINSGKSVFLFYIFDYHTIKHYIHQI